MSDLFDGEFEEIDLAGGETDGDGAIAMSGSIAGFVVVRIMASTANRSVWANGFVNDVHVCSASAADMTLAGAISSASQSFTMPVPRGAQFRIQASTKDPNHIRAFAIRA